MNYLYLLVSEDQSMFKIGVSQNPTLRARSLPDAIKYESSKEVAVTNEGDAYAIERMLHYLFRGHRLSRERGSGRTEWFSMEAFDRAIAYLSLNAGMLGASDVAPLRTGPRRRDHGHARTCAANSDGREKRQQSEERAAAELKKMALDLTERNIKAAENTSSMIRAMLDEKIQVRRDYGFPRSDSARQNWFLRIGGERGCRIADRLMDGCVIRAPRGGLDAFRELSVVGGNDGRLIINSGVLALDLQDDPVLAFAGKQIAEIASSIRLIDLAPGAENRAAWTV